jgi:hypothetical protein
MIFTKDEINAYKKIQLNTEAAIERIIFLHNSLLDDYGKITDELEKFEYLTEIEFKEENKSLDEDMITWHWEDHFCGSYDTFSSSIPLKYLSMSNHELEEIFRAEFQIKLDYFNTKQIEDKKIKNELALTKVANKEIEERAIYEKLKKQFENK